MKKLIKFFLLLVTPLELSIFSCNTTVPKSNLKTNLDSISYAQGVLLASHINQIFTQLNLNKTNKIDFIKGIQEGLHIDIKNKKETAFIVGKVIGHQLGTQVIPFFNKQLFGNDPMQTINKNIFLAGYTSTVKNDSSTLLSPKEIQKYSSSTEIEKIRKINVAKYYNTEKKENLNFLNKNKYNKGVVSLPSGLQYKILKNGNGPKPVITDLVKINYRGMNIKGKIFDSLLKKGKYAEFSLYGLIKGLAEGIQLMSVGSKYIFYIPYNLAYNDQFKGSTLLPYSTLIFEIDLHEIVKKNKSNGKKLMN